jgi:hypothetical protein
VVILFPGIIDSRGLFVSRLKNGKTDELGSPEKNLA